MSALDEISNILKEDISDYNYYIPSLWLGENTAKKIKVSPLRHFGNVIDSILKIKKSKINYNQSLSCIRNIKHPFSGDWTLYSSIYNIFVRLTTAFDHDNDGIIGGISTDITINSEGIRETGTFLKCIGLLPYLKSLGIDTIHLLPINAIGADGNKGDLGSPYAIKNPYEIDKTLADPLIYLPVEEQFKAFIEAAHILDMRVVLEFVFRTASKDADWIKTHPDWFYWIEKHYKDKYKSPAFSREELAEIIKIPEGNGKYIPPDLTYKNLFKIPPKPHEVRYNGSFFEGKTKQGDLIIPGAFADWPPDDIQPPWNDVTYLRMFNHPYDNKENYNYIAYNTIRYYDPDYAKADNANKDLWTMIDNIIPYYQQEFGIDGVMIDMGHALPPALKQRIINNARKVDPDFAFWDENFCIAKISRDEGYNAVIGHTWAVEAEENGFERTFQESTKNLPIPYLGTSETHNTPRACSKNGGILFSKLTYVLNSFLPYSIPFIHNGFELGELFPVNTGLCFTAEEQEFFSNKKLPLFYKASLNWLKKENITDFVNTIAKIRASHKNLITNISSDTIRRLETDNKNILVFERFNNNVSIIIAMNTNVEVSEKTKIKILSITNSITDQLSLKSYQIENNNLNIEFKKGEVFIFM